MLEVVNQSRQTILAKQVKPAVSFVERCVGLLGTSSLDSDQGLWISPCSSIHTLFMKYPIDVLFVDGASHVLAAETIVPWRFSGIHWKAKGVLELSAGTLQKTQTRVGDVLQFMERS